MKRALGLAMVLILVVTGVVAASTFPLPGLPALLPRGNGWRVIYADFPADTRFAFWVAAATDAEGFNQLWGEVAGLGLLAPPVSLERNIVAAFGIGTGSCTTGVSFNGLVIDEQRRLVHADISKGSKCVLELLDLTGSAVFLVAIARERLPESPFTLQLGPEPVCGSCADPSDRLIVDL